MFVRHDNPEYIAEWYVSGNVAYLWHCNTYIQCMDDPSIAELFSRGYSIIFKQEVIYDNKGCF